MAVLVTSGAWLPRPSSTAGPLSTWDGSPARSVRRAAPLPRQPSSTAPPPHRPAGRASHPGILMTSTLLSPSAATVRRTGAAGLAAALAASAPRWRPLVEYRPVSRWTHMLPAAEAADVLDPALHADLAEAQVW